MDRLEFAADYELEGNTLSGVVHVFGTRTIAPKGGVYHRFPRGSMDLSGAMAFYSHDTSKPLGRPKTMIEGDVLKFSVELGNQSYAQDLRENMALGLMNEMSFGVMPSSVQWTDYKERDGSVTRTYKKADIYDISPVARGAFPQTAGLLHSADAGSDRRVLMARARARVLAGGSR